MTEQELILKLEFADRFQLQEDNAVVDFINCTTERPSEHLTLSALHYFKRFWAALGDDLLDVVDIQIHPNFAGQIARLLSRYITELSMFMSSLLMKVKLFPGYSEVCKKHLERYSYSLNISTSIDMLLRYAEKLPNYADQIILSRLQITDLNRVTVYFPEEIIAITESFPYYKNSHELIARLLNFLNEPANLHCFSPSGLIQLSTVFPAYANQLIAYVDLDLIAADPESFMRTNQFSISSLTDLADVSPRHAEALVRYILANPDTLRRVIEAPYDISRLIQKFTIFEELFSSAASCEECINILRKKLRQEGQQNINPDILTQIRASVLTAGFFSASNRINTSQVALYDADYSDSDSSADEASSYSECECRVIRLT